MISCYGKETLKVLVLHFCIQNIHVLQFCTALHDGVKRSTQEEGWEEVFSSCFLHRMAI